MKICVWDLKRENGCPYYGGDYGWGMVGGLSVKDYPGLWVMLGGSMRLRICLAAVRIRIQALTAYAFPRKTGADRFEEVDFDDLLSGCYA